MEPVHAASISTLLDKIATTIRDTRHAKLATAAQTLHKLLQQEWNPNAYGEALIGCLNLCRKVLPMNQIDINVAVDLAAAAITQVMLTADQFDTDVSSNVQTTILDLINSLTNNPRHVRSREGAEKIISAGIEAYSKIAKTRPLLSIDGAARVVHNLYEYNPELSERLLFGLSAIDKLSNADLLKRHIEADSLLIGALKKVRHAIKIEEDSPDAEALNPDFAKAKLTEFYIATHNVEEAHSITGTISKPTKLVTAVKRLTQKSQLTPYQIGQLFDERERGHKDTPPTNLLLAAINYCAEISVNNILKIIEAMRGSKIWSEVWQFVQCINPPNELHTAWNAINDFTEDILDRLHIQAAVQILFDAHDSPFHDSWFAKRTLEFHKICHLLRNNEFMRVLQTNEDDDLDYVAVDTTYELKLVEALAEIALQAPDASARARRFYKLVASLSPDLHGFLYSMVLDYPVITASDETREAEWRGIYVKKIEALLNTPSNTATAMGVLAHINQLYSRGDGDQAAILLKALHRFARHNPDFALPVALARTRINIDYSD